MRKMPTALCLFHGTRLVLRRFLSEALLRGIFRLGIFLLLGNLCRVVFVPIIVLHGPFFQEIYANIRRVMGIASSTPRCCATEGRQAMPHVLERSHEQLLVCLAVDAEERERVERLVFGDLLDVTPDLDLSV